MASDPPSPSDRRRFRRVKAPVLVRPARKVTQLARSVGDIGEGGFRAFSDDAYATGERLEVELFFPAGGSVVLLTEVVWTEALPEGAEARFDVGLRFVEARREDVARIAELLGD